MDAGISRWGGVVRGGAEIRGAITRGGARNFPTGGLNLPTRGLKYCFGGTFTLVQHEKAATFLHIRLTFPIERNFLYFPWHKAILLHNNNAFQVDYIKIRNFRATVASIYQLQVLCKKVVYKKVRLISLYINKYSC